MKTNHFLLWIFGLFVLGVFSQAHAVSVKASTFGWNATDATTAFQNALKSSNDTIIVDLQASDWIVGPSKIFDLKNKTIIFEPGVVLLAKPGAFPSASNCLLQLARADSVQIYGYGATFKMQKAEYTTGEWRMCLSIGGCRNVSVFGLKLMDSGGDGVYIGPGTTSADYGENILLKDLWCDNNRRQGISVITAQHLRVENCWFTNTKGTLPEFGIDLEPDDSTHRLVDVVFDRCRITGNNGSGIGIAVGLLKNTSVPLDITFRRCYLSNNYDTSNAYVSCEIHLGSDGHNAVNGVVNFDQCMIENSQWTAVFARKTATGYKAIFNDCVFKDVSKNTTSTYNSPIFAEVTDYYNACPRFGGITFNRCFLSYSTAYPFLDCYGKDATSAGMGEVKLNDLTVVHPSPVTYNATRGGGAPGPECVFDHQMLTAAPKAPVSFSASGNLIECDNTHSKLNVSRAANSDTSFALGITCSISGTGTEGIDFSRAPGFLIIPQGSFSRADTLFVLKDNITEPQEQTTLTVSASPFYSIATLPQTVTLRDCGLPGIEGFPNSVPSAQLGLRVDFMPLQKKLLITVDDEWTSQCALRVYNCYGKRIADLTTRMRDGSVAWNTSDLGSAIYIVQYWNGKAGNEHKAVWVR